MSSRLRAQFEEVKLVYRNKTRASERPSVNSPDKAYSILMQAWDMSQIDLLEECKMLLLDRKLRLMSIADVSKGGMTGTIVDPKVVFATALRRRADSIILAHNHPSGNLNPSEADIRMTQSMIKAGEVLQLKVNDHLIVTSEGYNSII